MSIIMFLILGCAVGWLASQLLGREEGVAGSIVIGIIGSFIGSFISRLLTSSSSYLTLSWSGFLWSLIGSIVFVAILNAITHPRHYRHTA
jgi:uncharacterized membrane protein YeaQ/YmgE (transglycosylase-associated protein family)